MLEKQAVNRNIEKHACVNDEPLAEADQATFEVVWHWFRENGFTMKEMPYAVADEEACGHYDGKILLNRKEAKEHFPVGALLTEEVLHYITSSEDPSTSADFSQKYLQSILQIIVSRLNARNEHSEQRAFQSVLINELWKIIEKESAILAPGAK
jgi:hypothetical protein